MQGVLNKHLVGVTELISESLNKIFNLLSSNSGAQHLETFTFEINSPCGLESPNLVPRRYNYHP